MTFQDTLEISGDVIVTLRENAYNKKIYAQPLLEPGDRVLLTGKLSNAAGERNPGEFDYRKYLLLHGIYKTFLVPGYENLEVISKDNLDLFYQKILFPSKKFALESIDKNIHGDESAYLKGLVTGERSDISDEMKDAFVDAGVMHLIAVSGLNVAYIIISVTLMLSLFRVRLIPRMIITMVFLIYYCLFTGSSASIVRATVMGILVLLAFVLERKISFYNIIGISAMVILISDSRQLFDAGFILSFSATMSMAIFFSVFERMFINKLRALNVRGKKISLWLLVLFFTSLSAQLGTIPVTAIYFGKISFISLAANIIAVPLANLSLAVGFFQIIVMSFSGFLSSVIAETNNILLTLQITFIKWCSSLSFAYISLRQTGLAAILLYYLILISMLTIRDKNKIVSRLIICCLLFAGFLICDFDFNGKLKVTFLDVGQGDCTLVQTPDNRIILIDCGVLTLTYNSGERTISPYLRRNGIDRIDLLIITHLHMDHIGGVNFLLQNFKIGKIIDSGQRSVTPFTNTMDSLIINNNIPRETIRYGDMIDELNNMRIYFLFPTNNFVNENGYTINNNLNNGSVTFKLKYKDVEMFFGGDIEKEGERFLTDTYSDFLKSGILKVSHHGSITSTTIPFILKNNPEYAVISCGMFNKFNHPSEIVLSRLENNGTAYSRTDLDGAVIFETDGFVIDKINWK